MFQRLRATIARFMWGRYGNDGLNRLLLWVYLLFWFLAILFLGWARLTTLSRVDLPTLGKPTRPTSASSFSSRTTSRL